MASITPFSGYIQAQVDSGGLRKPHCIANGVIASWDVSRLFRSPGIAKIASPPPKKNVGKWFWSPFWERYYDRGEGGGEAITFMGTLSQYVGL